LADNDASSISRIVDHLALVHARKTTLLSENLVPGLELASRVFAESKFIRERKSREGEGA
jgi:hypothetical protein